MENNELLSLKKDWVGLTLASGRAVLRGGNWNNGANAGPFYANLNIEPSIANPNIGFRCCNSSKGQTLCFYENKGQCNRTTSIQIQAVFQHLCCQLNINKNAFAVSKMMLLLIESCEGIFIIVIKEGFIDMVKTHKNLFEKIVSLENLCLAYKKARRGKNNKEGVLKFNFNMEKELISLRKELIRGDYCIGRYKNFIIYEPKRRIISALPFRDRVVQHAICNIIEPIFDKRFIYDSYACRKNKGTYAGIERLQKFLRKKDFYVLKCDIKSYFPSINPDVLKSLIKKKIADLRLLKLIKIIIDSAENGVPIGNLTSQLFANIYLNELDYFVKQKLRCKFYIRYMDDFIILCEDKKEFYYFKKEIIWFLRSLKIQMHEKRAEIFPTCLGVDFLGYVIFSDYMKVRKRTVKRFLKRMEVKIRNYDLGILSFEKLMESFNSWNAYMEHGNTYLLKNKLKERWKNVM